MLVSDDVGPPLWSNTAPPAELKPLGGFYPADVTERPTVTITSIDQAAPGAGPGMLEASIGDLAYPKPEH